MDTTHWWTRLTSRANFLVRARIVFTLAYVVVGAYLLLPILTYSLPCAAFCWAAIQIAIWAFGWRRLPQGAPRREQRFDYQILDDVFGVLLFATGLGVAIQREVGPIYHISLGILLALTWVSAPINEGLAMLGARRRRARSNELV